MATPQIFPFTPVMNGMNFFDGTISLKRLRSLVDGWGPQIENLEVEIVSISSVVLERYMSRIL